VLTALESRPRPEKRNEFRGFLICPEFNQRADVALAAFASGGF
jgi:hypothetical protein